MGLYWRNMKNTKVTLAMFTTIILILTLAGPLFSFDEKAAAKDESVLQNQKAKNSYAVGVQMGSKLKGPSTDLDAELVSRGVKDALTGAKTLLTEAEMKAALEALQTDYRTKQQEAVKQLAEKNKKDGEDFLAGNKTKKGVVTLESGLQYKVLKAGDGKKPTAADTVVCHYRGILIDGAEFDSSLARNRPGTFALKHVIKGWSEALELMSVGSKWQLFIPPSLAYGESGPRGAGRSKIGPNATLIYEVELLSIQDAVSGGAPAAADIAGIQVSFKLDPRLTQGQYMGERWVSPPTYTTTLDTVEARVAGVDPKGSIGNISAKWIPSDPDMVTVSPGQGKEVKITVKRAGVSTLKVVSQGVSKALSVKATVMNEGKALQVEITQ
jgi:FKBP-type peptidyl-prolyl cis-trans isomerase